MRLLLILRHIVILLVTIRMLRGLVFSLAGRRWWWRHVLGSLCIKSDRLGRSLLLTLRLLGPAPR